MIPIDYENLFIYMSLIFAICIFILLLYGCAFAGGPQIEKFRDGTDNMKEQILLLLKDLKDKDTTTEDEKANLDVIIQTFSSSNVNVNDLVSIIKQLKRFAPASSDSQEHKIKRIAEATPETTPATPDTTQQDIQIPRPTPMKKRLPIDPATKPSPTDTPIQLATIKPVDK
jgi:septum formation inhibitor MinC